MQEIYRFNKNDYAEKGFDKSNGNLILDFIKECEKDFHNRFSPLYANNLYGNYSAMKLITNSFVDIPNEFCGMDGEYDFETNLKMDVSEKVKTIYAIGRADDEDEELFLIKDDKMSDGIIILKHIPDNDNDDENIQPEIPVNSNSITKKLVLTFKN